MKALCLVLLYINTENDYKVSKAAKRIEQLAFISSSVIINGGAIRKQLLANKNQSVTNPFFKQY